MYNFLTLSLFLCIGKFLFFYFILFYLYFSSMANHKKHYAMDYKKKGIQHAMQNEYIYISIFIYIY